MVRGRLADLILVTCAEYYEERYKRRAIHNLKRRARSLGLQLVQDEAASQGVS